MITEIKGILRYTISNGVMPIYITPLLPNKRNRRESHDCRSPSRNKFINTFV